MYNLRLFIYALATALCAGAANAACTVVDNDKETVIGRFQFDYAYRDCLKVYRNVYLRKFNDGNSELYLRCLGKAEKIAMVKDFKFGYIAIDVAGCAMPNTLG